MIQVRDYFNLIFNRFKNGNMDIQIRVPDGEFINLFYKTYAHLISDKNPITDPKICAIAHEMSICMRSFDNSFKDIALGYGKNELTISKRKIFHFQKLRNFLKYGNDKDRLYKSVFNFLHNNIDINNPIIFRNLSLYGVDTENTGLTNAINEFSKFWAVAQTTNSRLGMLSRPIDIIWHYCIGDTNLYGELCALYGGKHIVHEEGNSDSYQTDMEQYLNVTIPAIKRFGGTYKNPFKLWPLPSELFSEMNCNDIIKDNIGGMVTEIISGINANELYNALLRKDRNHVNSLISTYMSQQALKTGKYRPIYSRDLPTFNSIKKRKTGKRRKIGSSGSNNSTPDNSTDSMLLGTAAGVVAGTIASCSTPSSCPSCSTASCSSASCGSSCGGASCGGC